MSTDPEATALANSAFARALLHRAAEIFEAGQHGAERPNAYDALLHARNELLENETPSQRKQRTYAFTELSIDLGNFIKQRHPEYANEWGPINRRSQEQAPPTVVKTLQDSAVHIGDMVAERTRTAAKFDLMSEKERSEYIVMRKAVAFLQQQGLPLLVDWERENPEEDPIDYWSSIGGTRWAFEITALRKDAPRNHRKVGDTRSNQTVSKELEELSAPIPRVPDGTKELRSAFTEAIEHGNKPSKIRALGGAKYCLLIHNQQFLFEPSWMELDYPDFKKIDAVLILHADDVSAAHVWEVIPHQWIRGTCRKPEHQRLGGRRRALGV